MLDTTSPPTRLALLLDSDNFANCAAELGLDIDLAPVLAHLPRPTVARSFGDIAALPLHISKHKFRRNLQQHHVQHEDIPFLFGSKNSADIRIAVAATALAFERPEMSTFVLISGDRDFIPVADFLRSMGKYVIGVGPSRATVCPEYVSACDQFLFHAELVAARTLPATIPLPAITHAWPAEPTAPALPTSPTPSKLPIWSVEQVVAAIECAVADGKQSHASEVSQRLQRLFPQFHVHSKAGRFKRLCVQLAADTERIRIESPELANFVLHVADPAT